MWSYIFIYTPQKVCYNFFDLHFTHVSRLSKDLLYKNITWGTNKIELPFPYTCVQFYASNITNFFSVHL